MTTTLTLPPYIQSVLDVLVDSDTPRTYAQLSEASGVSPSNVSQALSRLRMEGVEIHSIPQTPKGALLVSLEPFEVEVVDREAETKRKRRLELEALQAAPFRPVEGPRTTPPVQRDPRAFDELQESIAAVGRAAVRAADIERELWVGDMVDQTGWRR